MKKYLEIYQKNLEKSWKYGILSVQKSGNPENTYLKHVSTPTQNMCTITQNTCLYLMYVYLKHMCTMTQNTCTPTQNVSIPTQNMCLHPPKTYAYTYPKHMSTSTKMCLYPPKTCVQSPKTCLCPSKTYAYTHPKRVSTPTQKMSKHTQNTCLHDSYNAVIV